MSLSLLLVISAVLLVIAYKTYGKWIARKLSIENTTKTPAHQLQDDVDYIPTSKEIVLGHHFSSIAGAGPIIGPIVAVTFGWIPAVIWILLGGIFIGAVHDFSSIVASLKHKGKSIGSIIHYYMGTNGKILFLIFSISTLLLVIAVFADVIAKTFVKSPAVASSSGLFVLIAIGFGYAQRKLKVGKKSFIFLTAIGVVLMYTAIGVGGIIPVMQTYWFWVIILLIYSFVAAVSPINLLLQPRDYLSSFLLYGMMLVAVLGIFIGQPEIKMDAQLSFHVENMGYMFPVLFITVACGAISGFHALVASGTTSKQIKNEKDSKFVGYGGMLIESFLAIISVIAVLVIGRQEYDVLLNSEGPVNMFSAGLGSIIASLGVAESLAVNFIALAVSAFALTTLDTCTRLARFSVQELLETKSESASNKKSILANRFSITLLVIVFSGLLLLSGEFTNLWPIFGSANQLLAALSLLALSLWMYKKGKTPYYIILPMIFMFIVTISSLLLVAYSNYNQQKYMLAGIALALLVLSVVLVVYAIKSYQNHRKDNRISII